eukprot:UN24970
MDFTMNMQRLRDKRIAEEEAHRNRKRSFEADELTSTEPRKRAKPNDELDDEISLPVQLPLVGQDEDQNSPSYEMGNAPILAGNNISNSTTSSNSNRPTTTNPASLPQAPQMHPSRIEQHKKRLAEQQRQATQQSAPTQPPLSQPHGVPTSQSNNNNHRGGNQFNFQNR